MGVKGLATFVAKNKNSLGKRIDWNDYDTLVVDGNSVKFFISDQVNWSLGSCFADFYNSVIEWIKLLKSTGLKLLFVLDGPVEQGKIDVLISRSRQTISRVIEIQQYLSKQSFIDMEKVSGSIRNLAGVCLNPLSSLVFLDALRDSNVELLVSTGEADVFIFQIFCEMQEKGRKPLVLSRDTDFFIFPVAYAPLDYMEIVKGSIELGVFEPFELAKAKQISKYFMPILAALCGCDYLSDRQGSILHRSLKFKVRKKHAEDVLQFLRQLEVPQSYTEAIGIVNIALDSKFSKETADALEKCVRVYTICDQKQIAPELFSSGYCKTIGIETSATLLHRVFNENCGFKLKDSVLEKMLSVLKFEGLVQFGCRSGTNFILRQVEPPLHQPIHIEKGLVWNWLQRVGKLQLLEVDAIHLPLVTAISLMKNADSSIKSTLLIAAMDALTRFSSNEKAKAIEYPGKKYLPNLRIVSEFEGILCQLWLLLDSVYSKLGSSAEFELYKLLLRAHYECIDSPSMHYALLTDLNGHNNNLVSCYLNLLK